MFEKKWLGANARKEHRSEGALAGVLVVAEAWQTRERIAHLIGVVKCFAVSCLSSIILSPLNGNVKMSPYEQGDICIEPERATTSGRYLQMREGGVGVCQSRRTPVPERAPN